LTIKFFQIKTIFLEKQRKSLKIVCYFFNAYFCSAYFLNKTINKEMGLYGKF